MSDSDSSPRGPPASRRMRGSTASSGPASSRKRARTERAAWDDADADATNRDFQPACYLCEREVQQPAPYILKGLSFHRQCGNAVRCARRQADLHKMDSLMLRRPDQWREQVSPLVCPAGTRRDKSARARVRSSIQTSTYKLRENVYDEVLLTKSRFKKWKLDWDGMSSREASEEFDRVVQEQHFEHCTGRVHRVAVKDNIRIRTVEGTGYKELATESADKGGDSVSAHIENAQNDDHDDNIENGDDDDGKDSSDFDNDARPSRRRKRTRSASDREPPSTTKRCEPERRGDDRGRDAPRSSRRGRSVSPRFRMRSRAGCSPTCSRADTLQRARRRRPQDDRMAGAPSGGHDRGRSSGDGMVRDSRGAPPQTTMRRLRVKTAMDDEREFQRVFSKAASRTRKASDGDGDGDDDDDESDASAPRPKPTTSGKKGGPAISNSTVVELRLDPDNMTPLQFFQAKETEKKRVDAKVAAGAHSRSLRNRVAAAAMKLDEFQIAQLDDKPQDLLNRLKQADDKLREAGEKIGQMRSDKWASFVAELDRLIGSVDAARANGEPAVAAYEFLVNKKKTKEKAKKNAKDYRKRKVGANFTAGGWCTNMAKFLANIVDLEEGSPEVPDEVRINPPNFEPQQLILWSPPEKEPTKGMTDEARNLATHMCTTMGKMLVECQVGERNDYLSEGGKKNAEWTGAMTNCDLGAMDATSFDPLKPHAEMLKHRGSDPWLVRWKAHACRVGPAKWPCPGMGSLVSLCETAADDVLVLAMPAAPIIAKGLALSDILSFLDTPSGEEYANTHIRAIPISMGQVLWLPYGYIGVGVGSTKSDDEQWSSAFVLSVASAAWATMDEACFPAIAAWNNDYMERVKTKRVWQSRALFFEDFVATAKKVT